MEGAILNLDDFDWSGAYPSQPSGAVDVPQATEEQAPPASAAPRPGRRSYKLDQGPVEPAEAAPAPRAAKTVLNLDDFDWGAGPMTSGPAYRPQDDYALTRGFKAGYEGGNEAIAGNADMYRISSLDPTQQAAAMIELGAKPRDPGMATPQVEGIQDIGGVGDFFTWLGENAGQMAGSMASAITTGGAAGAVTGGAAGSVLPGAGTIAGASTGATVGTIGSFFAMGTGGTFLELLRDEGVRKALQAGTITPDEVKAYAIGGGLVIGALDTIAPKGLLKMAGGKNIAADQIKKTILGVAIKGATKTGIEEGGTEAMQGAISEIGQAALGGNWDIGKRALSVINQGLAGAIGGAGPGAIAGIAENAQLPAPPSDQANPADPAGTRGPDPAIVPPTGPTGNANTPPPPAGQRPPAPQRDAGKTPTPAANLNVNIVGNGQVSPDIAAATGTPAADEEFAPEQDLNAPAPAAAPNVDPTLAAGLQAASAGKPQKSPAAPAPPAPPAGQANAAGQAPPVQPNPTVQAPVQGAPQVPDQPTVWNRQSIMDEFADPQGRIDMGAASDELKRRIAEALAAGRGVSIWIEGKPRKIVSVDSLGMRDEKNQPWGIGPILMPMPGNDDRIEITADSGRPPVAPVEPITPTPSGATEQAAPPAPVVSAPAPVQEAAPLDPLPAPVVQTQAETPLVPAQELQAQAPATPSPSAPVEAEQQKPAPQPTPTKGEKIKGKAKTHKFATHANKVVAAVAAARGELEAADKDRRKPLEPLRGKPKKAELLKRKEAHKKLTEGEARYAKARGDYAAAVATQRTTMLDLLARIRERGEESLYEQLDPETRRALDEHTTPEREPLPERAPPVREEATDRDTTRTLKEGPQEFPQAQQRAPLPEVPEPTTKTVRMTTADYERAVTGRGEEAVHEMLSTRSTVRRGKRRLGRIDAVTRNEKTGELEAKVSWRSKLFPLTELLGKYTVEIGGVRVSEGVAPAAAEAQPTATVPRPAAEEPQPMPSATTVRKGWQKPGLRKFRPVTEEVPAERKPKPAKTPAPAVARAAGETITFKGKKQKVTALIAKMRRNTTTTNIPARHIEPESVWRKKKLASGEPVTEQLRQALVAELPKEVSLDTGAPEVIRTPETPAAAAARRAEVIALEALDLHTIAGYVAGQERATAVQNAMTPGELASSRLVEAINKAKELVEQAKITVEQSRRLLVKIAHGEAMRLWRLQRDDERTGKYKGKTWEGIKAETYSTTWRAARRARRAEKRGATGISPHLLRIDTLLDRLAALKDVTGVEATVAGIRAEIAAEQDKRVEEAKKHDSEQARKEAQAKRDEEKQFKILNDLIDEEFAAGKFDEDTRDLLRLNAAAGAKYRTRVERSKKTTPAIRTIVAEHKLPDVGRDIGNTYFDKLRTYAVDLLDAIEDKIDLPEKMSRFFNTPEENALIFIRNRASSRKWMRLKKKMGEDPTEQERKESNVATPGDIYLAAALLHERLRKPGEKTEAYTRRANQAERDINHLFFGANDASLRSEPKGAQYYGSEAEQAELAASRREELNLDELYNAEQQSPTGRTRHAPLASQEDAGASTAPATREPIETTTVSQAIDKYMRGWQDRTGAPRGWRKLMQRALMRSLKTLIGSMPVHFVHSSVIFNALGRNAAGAFHDGKILLHEGIRNRPALLAQTLMHEMIHGGTAYALKHDIRGTRQIIQRMMNELKKQLGTTDGLPEGAAYAFEGPEEFVAQGLNDAEASEMLASLRVPVAVRAAIRALGRGREMPSWWDVFVAAIENAIGTFTPGRAGTSYLDQLLKLYPHMAMSHSEQVHDANLRLARGEIDESANDLLASPFNVDALKQSILKEWETARTDKGQAVRNVTGKVFMSTEDLRKRIADTHFSGNLKNPVSDLIDRLETGQREVSDEMQKGDKILDGIVRWFKENALEREAQVAHGHKTITGASVDKVDPRKPLDQNTWIRDDAQHPTKKPRTNPTWAHERDSFRRKYWQQYKEAWDKIPAALQKMLSDMSDHFSDQMRRFERKLVSNWLSALLSKEKNPLALPSGVSFDDAVDMVVKGKLSDEMKAALGKNAKTVDDFGKLGLRKMMYAPTHRHGRYVLSGRKDIAMPAVTKGTVKFDQKAFDNQGIYRFIFSDQSEAADYADKMAELGEERVVSRTRAFLDPITGEQTSKGEMRAAEGGADLFPAIPIYFVTMQDRFMTLGDSTAELLELKKELEAEGYKMADPRLTDEKRESSDKTTPLAVQRMLNNIDGMEGIEEDDKKLAKRLATIAFTQQQQGQRITKRMLNRKGVHGYDQTAAGLIRSWRAYNEMMSRHIVAADRQPAIGKAQSGLRKLIDARANRATLKPGDLAKFSAEEQSYINRSYGKDDALSASQLGEDVAEINRRISKQHGRSPEGATGERYYNALMQMAVMNYLAKPAYFAIQLLSLAMFTFPNMVKEMGWGAAWRYFKLGLNDINKARLGQRAAGEFFAEVRQFAEGFLPRKGWVKGGGRALRRASDEVEHLRNDFGAVEEKYRPALLAALEDARLKNFIGQAGMDQINLNLDLNAPNMRSKFLRGIQQSTRMFGAIQEGIETMNRGAPLAAWVRYYKDAGLSDAEAAARAVNNMTREQVGYSRANKPPWMTAHPLVETAVMFKMFGLQYAVNFWGSISKVAGSDPVARKQALRHVAAMSVALFIFGGGSGNPLWEPLKYLLWLMGYQWDDVKTEAEKYIAALTGATAAEVAMYGPPRLLGLDLSSRTAMDSLVTFSMPKTMEEEDIQSTLGSMFLGAPGGMAMDAYQSMRQLSKGDQGWLKWAGTLPLPGMAKDVFKAADMFANGPTTATGVSTGAESGLLDTAAQTLGIRTRAQARPFEQGSAAIHRQEERADALKSEITRAVINQGYTARNMARIRSFNEDYPGKRITVKSLSQAKKRRRRTEKEIAKGNVAYA